MANLITKSLETLVREQAAAVQGASRNLTDFSIGSILRAIAESVAAVTLWLQGLVLQVLATTRASTSAGEDLDTWMADYNFSRLPAVAATGAVRFSRFSTGLQALIPVGSIIQTADASRRYSVVADSDHANFDDSIGTSGGYRLSATYSYITIPVACTVAGTIGNVPAGAITLLSGAIAGIDTVSNTAALVNGRDAEADEDFRSRFWEYIASLRKGTPAAIADALHSIQQGVDFQLVENYSYAGAWQPGYFYIVVDDGGGDPSSAFISAAQSAIEKVRPVGARFGVFAPQLVAASISATISTASGYDHAAVVGVVNAALSKYVGGLKVGADLRYSRLSQVIYNASPGVTNISGLLLNGGTSDLIASPKQRITTNTIAIS